MFTGHINQLPGDNYLSATLLNRIQQAFDAIRANPVVGEQVLIEGELSYSIIEGQCTSPVGKPAEIHRQNIDVHLVLAGQDHIGYSNHPLTINDDSNASSDLYFGPLADENYVALSCGEFAIFFPGEVHKPMCHYHAETTPVTKAIIKIVYDKL